MSSQYVVPGASYLSKFDSNSLLPLDHRNEKMPTVRNQSFAVVLLVEVKLYQISQLVWIKCFLELQSYRQQDPNWQNLNPNWQS